MQRIIDLYIRIYRKILTKKNQKKIKNNIYCNRNLLTEEAGNNYISDILENNKNVFIGRIGATEGSVVYLHSKKKILLNREKKLLKIQAGFFPVDEKNLKKFDSEYISSIKNSDAIAVWGPSYEEDLIKQENSEALIFKSRALEPYYFENPWSEKLKGKKVLVINPFVSTIESQYKKRRELFENEKILPEFELITLKSPQTLGDQNDGFSSWWNAIDNLKNKIDKVDYDVALVSCGSYGMPISNYIKQNGKTVIYMGGALQVLFGIKGKRWDSHPIISKLYNQNWVYVNQSDKPRGFGKVEGGCYW